MLTAQQANLLNFIRFHQSEHDGVSPSYEQMKEALGLKSKSGISRLIEALVQRGFIRRRPHLARAIEVLERAVVTPSPVRLAPTDALIAEITARGFDVRRVA